MDVLDAKAHWTAPFYQYGGNVTAFSVVNMAKVAQSVNVTIRDFSGSVIAPTHSTPVLAAGCGCNTYVSNTALSAAGGYSATMLADFFAGANVATIGTLEFTSPTNQPFIVLVLRVNGKNLSSVPAI